MFGNIHVDTGGVGDRGRRGTSDMNPVDMQHLRIRHPWLVNLAALVPDRQGEQVGGGDDSTSGNGHGSRRTGT